MGAGRLCGQLPFAHQAGDSGVQPDSLQLQFEAMAGRPVIGA